MTLQCAGCAAPRPRIDICNGLREVPAASGEIFDAVLALAVRIVGRWTEDPRSMLAGLLAVTIYIFNSHHHGVPDIGSLALGQLGQYDGSVANVQLGAVIADSHAEGETKGVAEPVDGFPDIRICELRDHSALRTRPIFKHPAHLNKTWRPPRGGPRSRR